MLNYRVILLSLLRNSCGPDTGGMTMGFKIFQGDGNHPHHLETKAGAWLSDNPSHRFVSMATAATLDANGYATIFLTIYYEVGGEKTATLSNVQFPSLSPCRADVSLKELLMREDTAGNIIRRFVPQEVREGIPRRVQGYDSDHNYIELTFRDLIKILPGQLNTKVVGARGNKKIRTTLEACVEYLGLRFGMTDAEIEWIVSRE